MSVLDWKYQYPEYGKALSEAMVLAENNNFGFSRTEVAHPEEICTGNSNDCMSFFMLSGPLL